MSVFGVALVLFIVTLGCFVMRLAIIDESNLVNAILILVAGGLTVWDFSRSIHVLSEFSNLIITIVAICVFCVYYIFCYGVFVLFRNR